MDDIRLEADISLENGNVKTKKLIAHYNIRSLYINLIN